MLLLVGCGGAGDTDSGPFGCDEALTVEIGTGVDAWEPLAELEPLEMVYGPQGGYHLPGAVRVCSAAEGTVVIHFVGVQESTGGTVVDVTYERTPRPDGACCATALDLIGYLSLPGTGYYGDPGEVLDGETIAITMTVTDAGGVEASATLRVVAEAPTE